MKYDDKQYINDYVKFNRYPRIHNDITSMDKYIEPTNVLDIGSSIGLLSLRLAQRHQFVLGLEYSKKSVENALAIKKENTHFINLTINIDTLHEFETLIQEYNINAVYARRVLPELYNTGGSELINEVVDILHRNNVRTIVIEGRQRRKNTTHELKDVSKEVKYFEEKYRPAHRYKECVLMTIK